MLLYENDTIATRQNVQNTFEKEDSKLPILLASSKKKKRKYYAYYCSHGTESTQKQNWCLTFFNPLVMYVSTGDLISLSLLIFLKFLGILHLLPLSLIQITL